jgi:hypothetical protein
VKLGLELEASLRELSTSGSAELCENGSRLAPLSKLSWEVRGSGDKPLLHIGLSNTISPAGSSPSPTIPTLVWSSQSSDSVAAVPIASNLCVSILNVRLVKWPARNFAPVLKCAGYAISDETVESISVAADLEHSLSGNYARGLFKRGSSYAAFLAVPEGETQDTINNWLTFGVLWLDRVRNTVHRGTVAALRLIVPKDSCCLVAHRLAALEAAAPVEIYEYDNAREVLEKIDPRLAGNLQTWLIPVRESEALLAQARGTIDPIVALDPKAIAVHPSVASREVILRYRGLAFARWDDGRVFFGMNDMRKEVTLATQREFDRTLRT